MTSKKPTLLIGTDPEVFLRHKETGRMVSAFGMFPGTKDEPYPLKRGALQVDGHALEFNTQPVDNEDEFVHVVNFVFDQVKEEVARRTPSLEIALEPIARFEEHYFATLPPSSKELGCNPDYSAETGNQLESPAIGDIPLRTGSGHIHLGWTEYDEPFGEDEFRKRLILANRITPALLSIAKDWETPDSDERRLYYGREGAFRPKHYGVELRALDNLWLKNDESIRKVFRTASEAFHREYANAL